MMKLSEEQREAFAIRIRHAWMAIRVVFGALVTWVPWTAIRFVVCWSVPLVLHGEQPDVFNDPP